MKKISLIFTALFLAACSTTPNLVKTHSPILNIDVAINPFIDAAAQSHEAWVKNTGQQPLQLHYDLFWYSENGVTQPASQTQDAFSGSLLLQPQQKQTIELTKPTPESVNYRLYLRK
ncbi:YcfL family protein [Actinobacillus porcinus]|uniref:YcfL family protein n=1 Tax=Actinobacillus porcinus TaxID=51048 RepID=UPI002A90C050|nr:YcfL family protein [Actinobacillus porcinus]MDY6216388.1 YcfL family protein [Actinobacillus porcinus]